MDTDTTARDDLRVPIVTTRKADGSHGRTHLRWEDVSSETPCGRKIGERDLKGNADVLAAVDCKRCRATGTAQLQRLREWKEAAANLPKPAPNRPGEIPHADPFFRVQESTCTVCGADVFFDGTDDEGTGIWTHTETLDYFCEED